MKIALLCSGLGNINRGHEIFARDLFSLLKDELEITLFKGGGPPNAREVLIPNLPRRSPCLDHIHVRSSSKWAESMREQERTRIESVTFAYGSLQPLLEGDFDIIHCLEREVCEVIWAHRHLFRHTPKVVFSNGGAIPARELPPCDFVQEHTPYNLSRSAREKAFMIPHGVDLDKFRPGVVSDFRVRHGIPETATVVISVGTICYWHKRMDHVIREVAPLQDIYLVIAGQESTDSQQIKDLGRSLMGGRVVFVTLPHNELPNAYAASDIFVLGSLFETFGIVYIEAMAMGLPVISTNHPNQRGIIKEGIFIDMNKSGALTEAIRELSFERRAELARCGPDIVRQNYDLNLLRQQYVEKYQHIASRSACLPGYSLHDRLLDNLRNIVRWVHRRS